MRVCVTLPVDELDKVAACVDETVREEVPVIVGVCELLAVRVWLVLAPWLPVGDVVGVAP